MWQCFETLKGVTYEEMKKEIIDVIMARNPTVWPATPPASFRTNGEIRYMLVGTDDDDLVYIRDDKTRNGDVDPRAWNAPGGGGGGGGHSDRLACYLPFQVHPLTSARARNI